MCMDITLIRGDGIGPEVMEQAVRIIKATGVPVEFEEFDAGIPALEKYGEILPDDLMDSIRRNRVALKGPITTPVGGGFRSINISLRQAFGLYANVRRAFSYEGIQTPFRNVDILTVRENTEGLYCGIEDTPDEDTARSVRLITRKASEKVIRYAFEAAVKLGRKKVSAAHKANILKETDGLFLRVFEDIAKDYPGIVHDTVIIDACAMKLVTDPQDFDVIVTTNLFGDILSDLTSGLVGGLGLTCGNNIGDDAAIFEAIHGSAPDIAGKGIANPSAVICASSEMLHHIGYEKEARAIEEALKKTFREGRCLTADLGGSASTEEFGNAVIDNLG
ncbi:MAG: NAD-dependent isocitrate dehydrogenase [Eubacteriaceae bacterium]|nr:NAD-dependent isocitrate dehydrogenase [Eubacteriaceae bacterium]